MSPIVPSLPPHLVQLGLRLRPGRGDRRRATAARLAPEVEQLPGLLPAIAELIVFPVTALSDDTDPCADSFVLDEVGVIYLMAIREWATHAPVTAAPGIARTIAHFVGQVLADAPKDVAPALRALRDEQVARACTVVENMVALHHWRTASIRCAPRCAPPSIGAHPLGGRCAPVRLARGSGAHRMDSGAVEWARVETVEAVRFSLT